MQLILIVILILLYIIIAITLREYRDLYIMYLEGNKYGEDVRHKEKGFVKDQHTNDPSDAHYE